ncbi:hypothetical protein JXA34_04175 [Patescibacteria group bacterium]|nr:hypothetical protein [Patescibacteria group bacterium]
MASTWQNVLSNVKRERLLSISNIVIMSVTFMLLGVLVYVVALSQTALRYLERQAQVTVFFEDTFSEQDILNMRNNLMKDLRVLDVKYVSKADAFKLFTEINKDEPILLESISEDILPASLEIKTVEVADLKALADEISSVEGVEEVRFFENVVAKFIFWSNLIYIVGTVLVVLFLLISYSVVMVTLRTTINSKGIELEIMKLVGASDTYVKRPLIFMGVLFGFVSAVVAGSFSVILGFVMSRMPVFSSGISLFFLHQISLTPVVFSFVLFSVLLFSGILLGYLGSYTAVRRYLKY